jgi:CxxC motif-containing protein (DUF1111 family)
VLAGDQLFEDIGCATCHVPTLVTGASEIAVLDRVDFHPYTDLLLHDMGPGLNDGYTEGRALTSEWRTPPLWGIGIQESFPGWPGVLPARRQGAHAPRSDRAAWRRGHGL